MAGILDWITESAKKQYQKGAPYREAVRGLLRGDTSGWDKLNAPTVANPQEAVDIATGFAGTIKPVGKTAFEAAQEVAQLNASLPVSQGGLGLPANNTAMDRAKALGFDTENIMYHGSGKKINEFKNWQSRKNRSSDGIFFTDNKDLAKEYGRVANEAYLKKGKNYLYDAQGNSFSDIDTQNALLRRLRAMNGESSVTMNNFVDAPNPFQNSSTPPSTITAINQPNQIRSPNAAFDPFRRNEADILAGVAAAPVGLLAVDKDKKKKKNK